MSDHNNLMEILREASLGQCNCKDADSVCGWCVIETAKAILDNNRSLEKAVGQRRH